MSLDNWTIVTAKQLDQLGDYEYAEAKDSYSMSFTPGGGITRIYYVAWDVVDTFMDDLLGFSYIDNNGTSINWTSLPDQDNFYKNCYALEASMEPQGMKGKLSDGIPDYTLAKVTVQYKQVDFAVKSNSSVSSELDRFVTRVGGYDGEMFTVNNTGLRFVSNVGSDGTTHLSLSQPPSRMTGVQSWTYIWRYVPAVYSNPFRVPNATALQNCLGKVHAPGGSYYPSPGLAFDKNNNAFLPGTVLFVGAEPRMHTSRPVTGDRNGNFMWEIAMKFLYRDNGLVSRTVGSNTINERAGHQFIWDQGLGQWDLITTDGNMTGKRLFESADLNSLFTIG